MKDNLLEMFEGELRTKIYHENTNQLNKWGIQDHEPSEWLMFLTEEQGELANAVAEWQYRNGNEENVINEAIQVVTLGLKIAEMFMLEKAKRWNETYYSQTKNK